MAEPWPSVAASSRVLALAGSDLRRAVAAVAQRLPAATTDSQVVFAFDHDRAAFAIALLAVWSRGHAVALPASARRRHVGPVLQQAVTVALVHDTGAGLGIDVARLLTGPLAGENGPSALRAAGPLRVFAAHGAERHLTAATLQAQIGRAITDLALQPGSRVVNHCALHSAAALVPGLLAPLATGAWITDVAADADLVIAPRGARATATGRTIVVDEPPERPQPVPARQPLQFTALPPLNGEAARFRTTVPRDFFGFAGHFPGYPVLSGAVQLHELVLPCVAAANGAARVAAFQDLKFLARIAPGDTVEVALRRDDGRGHCGFEVVRGTVRCSAGRAVLRAAEAESAP